jgi:hypothetical protein
MFLFPTGATVSSTPFSLSFIDAVENSANQTAYTFSGVSIGDADAGREVIVGVAGISSGGDKAVSTLTIGGVSASLVFAGTNTGSGHGSEFWRANVPTGTTGDIVVTWGGAMACTGVGIYRMVGGDTTVENTAENGSNPMVTTISVSAGGAIIGCGFYTSNATYAWTNLTEKYDEQMNGGDGTHTGATDTFVSAQTNRSITCNPSISGAELNMILSSWKPG